MPHSEDGQELPVKTPLLILCGAAHAQKAALADVLAKMRVYTPKLWAHVKVCYLQT